MTPGMSKGLLLSPLPALLLASVLAGCATSLGERRRGQMQGETVPSPYLGNFEKLWSERTVTLTPEQGGGRAPSFGGSGEEPSAGASAFLPLIVRVTYMDSALIAEGFRTFERLASMNADEEAAFVSGYGKTKASHDSIFVWAELRTSATEDYLNLDRWTFFLEQEDGRQVEPGRIVQHQIRRESASPSGQTGGWRTSPGGGATASKSLELYFGNLPAWPGTHDSTKTRTVRIGMLEAKNPSVRVVGSWQISSDGAVRNSR